MTADFEEFARIVTPTDWGPEAELVWTNPLGGRTYRLNRPGDVQYLKISPPDVPSSHDLTAEAERLVWIGSRVRVPAVLDSGGNASGTWLRTRQMSGLPASDHRWSRDPHQTAVLLGRSIRRFHDQLSPAVTVCPWSWRVADRVRARGTDQAADMSRSAPPELDLVVAHGDLCAPNILLNDDPDQVGFLDVGRLGIADRAADLGCHLWSLDYNGFGNVSDDFLDAYGFTGERADVDWYREFYRVA